MYCSQFITRYGAGIVYAADHGVVKVEIPDLSCNQTTAPVTLPEFESSETTVQVAHMLERYFQGECIDFSSIPVLFDAMTPFRRTVLKVIRTLGFGEICSYGDVAHMCGSPHAARAVGGGVGFKSGSDYYPVSPGRRIGWTTDRFFSTGWREYKKGAVTDGRC